MAQGFGAVVTVRVTVGLLLVPVLLEVTPLASTPIRVKVYVLFGVTPTGLMGGLVELELVLPQAGISRKEPLTIKSASRPQNFRDPLRLDAPNPISASIGTGSQSA